MKKLLLLAFVLSPFGCGDRDRIYKGDKDDGDITIIRDLGGSSCVCQANQPCQCVPPVPQQPGQPNRPQQPTPVPVPVTPCNQSPCPGNNQLGQPVNITINNNSNATNKVDMNQCQRSYSFNTNKTFSRQVTCQNGQKCQAQGTWTPIQQQQQPQPPWEPVPTTQYNLEYDENTCGDCQSEIVTI